MPMSVNAPTHKPINAPIPAPIGPPREPIITPIPAPAIVEPNGMSNPFIQLSPFLMAS